jgi:hypothetical protein
MVDAPQKNLQPRVLLVERAGLNESLVETRCRSHKPAPTDPIANKPLSPHHPTPHTPHPTPHTHDRFWTSYHRDDYTLR